MVSQTQQQSRNREGVRKWYGENRDEYNALRRKRYAENEEARKKARERAARYRDEKPTIDRRLFREVNGKKVEVFSTGQVAEMLDRTPQMLRNWQIAELIPASSFTDKHRLYTKRQVRMLISLAKVIKDSGGSWAATKVQTKVRLIHKKW